MKHPGLTRKLLSLTIILTLAHACSYDKKVIPCGDKIYRYSDVEPYFNSYGCTSCHDGNTYGPDLRDSTAIRKYISSSTNRTVFEGSIDFSGNPMPRIDAERTGEKMPDSCITSIKTWICQGMK
jgi:hypothetical protein